MNLCRCGLPPKIVTLWTDKNPSFCLNHFFFFQVLTNISRFRPSLFHILCAWCIIHIVFQVRPTYTMGEQKKSTKTTMHMKKFMSWKVDRRVSELVQATYFKNFLKFEESKHKLNLPLLTAVMSFFDDKQKAFSFPAENSMVDFGLEDILYITGLPIDGKQVYLFNFTSY